MTYKILFLTGLLFCLVGQVLLARGNEFVYSQHPIDFAHWCLLIGVFLLIPQLFSFPATFFTYLGIPLTLIGIACTIGMCVVDFILWSFPSQELRNEFIAHVSTVPSIWKPFVTVGPSSKVFNLGLLILALNYFEERKAGIIMLLVADLILWRIIPLPYRLVAGYTLTLVGFIIIFSGKRKATIQTIH